MAKAKAKPKASKNGSKKSHERPVLYPEVTTEIVYGMTADRMRDLLGWEEETPEAPFGDEFTLKDRNGKKVRLTNNVANRQCYESTVETFTQEMLNKKWRLNGESGIIGRTGEVLSLQHRGAALVLANQALAEQTPEGAHWRKIWKGQPVTIDMVLVYGVDEDDDTANTIDTPRVRTLLDVIYRSKTFAKYGKPDKAKLSAILANAVRTLWERTGAEFDAWAPRRTHQESMDFVERHPSLKRAAVHVFEERANVSKLFPLGGAAAFLYLMAACRSDGVAYRSSDPPSERRLDLSEWDRAEQFWTLVGTAPEFEPLRAAIDALPRGPDGSGPTLAEKRAVIVKGWTKWVSGKAMTPKNLAPYYDDTGKLDGVPVVGGADVGNADLAEADKEAAGGGKPGKSTPTPEEIEEEKSKILAERNLEAEFNDDLPPPEPVRKPRARPKAKPVEAPSEPVDAFEPESAPEPVGDLETV